VVTAKANAGPNEDILAAARAGDRSGVETALAAGASVNAVDEKGLSPLGLAGLTPLGLTAAYGHRNIAELLLDHGASVGAKGGLGETPLHLASEYGYADVAALLLNHGGDIDARDSVGATPLEWAAFRGNIKAVTLLIARGAIVNAQSTFGKTALHLAAAAGHKEIVAFLLAHGADAKIRNSDGQTSLQEMRASLLDPATKANIAAMLSAKRAPPYLQKPAATTAPPPLPVGSQSPPQNGSVPACTDVAGIARLVMRANPGISPAVLAVAVQKVQITMGCRQAPQKTECCWIGSTTGQPTHPLSMAPPMVGCVSNGGVTTCNNSSPNAPLVTCLTIGDITTCN
jgi:Ankyrin repeats (3 copies)